MGLRPPPIERCCPTAHPRPKERRDSRRHSLPVPLIASQAARGRAPLCAPVFPVNVTPAPRHPLPPSHPLPCGWRGSRHTTSEHSTVFCVPLCLLAAECSQVLPGCNCALSARCPPALCRLEPARCRAGRRRAAGRLRRPFGAPCAPPVSRPGGTHARERQGVCFFAHQAARAMPSATRRADRERFGDGVQGSEPAPRCRRREMRCGPRPSIPPRFPPPPPPRSPQRGGAAHRCLFMHGSSRRRACDLRVPKPWPAGCVALRRVS
jgi:hypothetical protein